MTYKHDLATGRGIAQAVEAQSGVKPNKQGSYLVISKNGRTAYIPDTARTLPKPVRSAIIKLLTRMGLLAMILLGIVICVLLPYAM